MKKGIRVAIFITAVNLNAYAQISIPVQQIDKAKFNTINSKLTELENDLKSKQNNLKKLAEAKSETKQVTDSITNIENAISETKEELKEIIKTTDKFALYGNAALATSDKVTDLSAITNVIGVINFHPKVTGAIGFNIKGVQPESVNRDSVNLNNLMFPDAGNAGFFASIGWDCFPNSWSKDISIKNSGIFYFDFAFKQTNFTEEITDSAGEVTDKNSFSFSVLNYNAGFKYRWNYKPKDNPKNNVDLTAQVYYNAFNIPNEDEKKFNRIYKDSVEISFIHSFGFKATLSFRGVSIFGDFRGNLGTKKLQDENVLKGFVFNVGTKFTTEIIGN